MHRQKSCQGTDEANSVFLASASAIILLMAFELKFKCCILDANIIGFSDLSGIKWDNAAPTPYREASHGSISGFLEL